MVLFYGERAPHYSFCKRNLSMGRKKKKKEPDYSLSNFVKPDTLRSVWAVLLVVVAIFLVLAAFSIAGFVGEAVFGWLSSLLGVGYALLPVSLLMFAVVLFRALEERVGILKVASSFVFLFSTLGLVNIL